jgi:large repetitive protein
VRISRLLVANLVPVVLSMFAYAVDVKITTSTLPNGVVAVPYVATIDASEGCTPFHWSIKSGSLPAGLEARASSSTRSYVISGTPRTAQTAAFTVEVKGCEGLVATRSYSVKVADHDSEVEITTSSLPNGAVAESYAATIDASGGCTPYHWSIKSGSLPAGLEARESSSTTAYVISGIPRTAETSTFTVEVMGCAGLVATRSYRVMVAGETSEVKITTSSLANGVVGESYGGTIDASGGCTPYRWSIKSGSLPAGLEARESSSTRSYVISGTPTTAETRTFTIEVMGCAGLASTRSYSLNVQTNYSVSLRWDASASPDIIGYNVYRATVSGGPYSLIASHIGSTKYTDKAVEEDKTYYYVSTAVNTGNEQSSYSNQVKVSVP